MNQQREIKFKYYVNGKMHEPFELCDAVYQGDGFTVSVCDTAIWLQYTGLKDKHGKEVYEGDIVRVFLRKGTWFDGYIKWHNLKFLVMSIEGKGGEGDWTYKYIDDPKKVEIIGNIHENPELLET